MSSNGYVRQMMYQKQPKLLLFFYKTKEERGLLT